MKVRMEVKNLNVWYRNNHAIIDVNLNILKNRVTALIGPSGCGKSTLIKTLDRMNDIIPACKITGEVILDGKNIYDKDVDVIELRKKIGMVFQKPNPFPKTIYDNVAFGPMVHGMEKKKSIFKRRQLTGKHIESSNDPMDKIVVKSLKEAAVWDEVKDRLHESAMSLSGGQQQRLCIARTLAVGPEVILFDEPCSALDPLSTTKIEDLIDNLKKKYTVVIVTHNMQQAARVSDYTAYLYLGKLIEYGETKQIFENPKEESTEKYITGRFG